MAFELAPLPYAHNALEPHIDELTMQIHHGKHHAAYTTNLNAAIAGTDLEGKSIETILAVRNEDHAEIVSESSDLIFHLLVLLAANNITLDEIATELTARHESMKRD